MKSTHKTTKKVTKAPKKKGATKVVKKSAPKKGAAKKVTKSPAIKKTTKTVKKASPAKAPAKKKTKKALPSKTKKSAQKAATPQKSIPVKKTVTAQPATPNEADVKTLMHIAPELDMVAFRHAVFDNQKMDLVYSSDDTAVVCKVLSGNHKWTVDMRTSVEKSAWTDETGKTIYPCANILIQSSILASIEPTSEIHAAIVLVQGTIRNDEQVVDYLKKHGIQLLKYAPQKSEAICDLHKFLEETFAPALGYIGKSKSSSATKKAETTSVRKAAKSPYDTFMATVATLGPIGYFPKGSGTLGALVALPIAYILNRISPPLLWISTLFLILLGLVAVQQFTADKKEKDPGCVIIDEVVGQLIAFWLIAPEFMHWPILFAGFALFRFFDIFKFGSVAFWDRRKNPVGVMMDDVTAGIFSGFILVMMQLLIQFFVS